MIRTINRPLNFRNGRLGISAAVTGGLISAGVSLATDAANIWMNSIQLSHDADSATTAIVNGLATQLTNVKNAYFAEANPTCADQRAALDAIDQGIAWLQSPAACGNPAYGAAGNRCISERAFPGAEYSYVDEIRTPIAQDPRLASAACDTSSEIFLPSLSTGTYQATGITASAGSASTGQTAAQIVAAAAAQPPLTAAPLTSNPTIAATVTAGIPTPVLIGGVVLVAVFLMSGSGGRS